MIENREWRVKMAGLFFFFFVYLWPKYGELLSVGVG